MKVFKFYSDRYYYAYSGNSEEEAKESLFEEVGEINIEKVEEIPESEWDEKTINVWEDNDFEKEPYKESIRDSFIGNKPQMVYTNDYSLF
jgi:hypothetical protein